LLEHRGRSGRVLSCLVIDGERLLRARVPSKVSGAAERQLRERKEPSDWRVAPQTKYQRTDGADALVSCRVPLMGTIPFRPEKNGYA